MFGGFWNVLFYFEMKANQTTIELNRKRLISESGIFSQLDEKPQLLLFPLFSFGGIVQLAQPSFPDQDQTPAHGSESTET